MDWPPGDSSPDAGSVGADDVPTDRTTSKGVRVEQRYVGRTNVLSTSLETDIAEDAAVDVMPWGKPLLVRRLTVTNTGDRQESFRLTFAPTRCVRPTGRLPRRRTNYRCPIVRKSMVPGTMVRNTMGRRATTPGDRPGSLGRRLPLSNRRVPRHRLGAGGADGRASDEPGTAVEAGGVGRRSPCRLWRLQRVSTSSCCSRTGATKRRRKLAGAKRPGGWRSNRAGIRKGWSGSCSFGPTGSAGPACLKALLPIWRRRTPAGS